MNFLSGLMVACHLHDLKLEQYTNFLITFLS